jgi:aldehyde dehydrogenase (NAD+)
VTGGAIVLDSWIGGSWRPGPRLATDIDPAHPLEPLATVRGADAALAAEAVTAARAAAPAWRRLPAPARADLLAAVAARLEAQADTIGRDMAREEGKTLPEAVGEVHGAAAQLRYAAGRAHEPDGATVSARDPGTRMLWSRREPLGVVVAITPWNFPLAIPAWKLAHALATGNTVVWKPAELTPMTSVHLSRCFEEAGLPAGVVNMVLGDGLEVGRALVESDDVDGISFTGSTAVGADISRRAPLRTRTQLEMGGSNPAVVLADADLDLAAEQVAQGAFLSAGQKCTATARVIVEASVHDELCDRLIARATSWTVGDPLDPATVLGPVASAAQYDGVRRHLAAAPASAVVAGGVPPELGPGDGYYIAPTVFAGIDPTLPVASEEVFGPVTSLLRARDMTDAVRLANASSYGLSASVFSRDIDRCLGFADEVEVGVVKINKATTGNEIHVPFGGRKQSGSGSPEMGWAAAEFFTEWKTVYVGRGDV